ncbi:MAG: MMPL family transporter [Candidatus Moranbacteria bacterium]|nr:MMPL family transporter [Candidatus Moranbacteria bacterium]
MAIRLKFRTNKLIKEMSQSEKFNPESKKKLIEQVESFEKSPLSFFIRNTRVTFLVILLLLIVGIFQIGTLPKEREPEVKVPFGIITTVYPGASPLDIEEQITKEIESKISDLNGIKTIESSSNFGMSQISVEFEADQDLDDSLRKLKDKVDEAKPDLPEDASDPNVLEINFNDVPVLVFSLRGANYDKSELKQFGEDLKDKLKSITNVNKVEVIGGEEREIQVEVKPEQLNELGLSVTQIIQTIKAFNTNFPIGSVEVDNFSYAARVENQFQTAEQVGNLIITNRNGVDIRVKDVAQVREDFQKTETISRISIGGDKSEESVSLQIYKRTGGDVTEVADKARKTVEENRGFVYPEDLDVVITTDTAKYAEDSINTLIENGIGTIIIILVLLILFVGLRESMITSLAIPFSFFIAFTVLAFLDQTLNGISLFSLVLALGLLVDSAMVIVEGMYEKISKYKMSGYAAALLSIKEYSSPLTSGMLTTVAVFVPLLFVKGIMGEFMRVIPITVISTLIAALFVALTIVPAIGATILKPKSHEEKQKKQRIWPDKWLKSKKEQYLILLMLVGILVASSVLIKIDSMMIRAIQVFLLIAILYFVYSLQILKKTMNWLISLYDRKIDRIINSRNKRVLILASAAILLMVSLMIPIISMLNPKIGLLKIEQFGEYDADEFTINLTMPEGTVLEETQKVVRSMEEKIRNLEEMENYIVSIGANGENKANFTINLTKEEERELTSGDISEIAREKLKTVTQGEVTVQEMQAGPPGSKPIEVKLAGNDLVELGRISDELKQRMIEIPGAEDIQTDMKFLPGEFLIIFDQEILAQYGLKTSDLAYEIRNGISGNDDIDITKQGQEMKIRVGYPENQIKNINELRNLPINTGSGKVFLGELGDISLSPSISSIKRVDQKRTVKITGRNADGKSPKEIIAAFQEKVRDYNLPAGYELIYGGENEELNEVFSDMFAKMIIGVILVFFILVVQFNSYRQALIIIYTAPLAMIGVIWGLTAANLSLDIPAFVGIVSLVGIVVNDAIILIDQINLNRKKGYYLMKSVVKAGHARMQPIMLTTATTVFGLLPLSIRDPNWRNMGFAIIFGLSFSTLLVLIVAPTFYVNFYKMRFKAKELYEQTKIKAASFWLRLVALAVDFGVILIMTIGIGALVMMNVSGLENYTLNSGLTMGGLALLLMITYNTLMIYVFGTTVGKAFVETRVGSATDKDLSLRRLISREIIKFVTGVLLIGTFVFVVFSAVNLFDKLSGEFGNNEIVDQLQQKNELEQLKLEKKALAWPQTLMWLLVAILLFVGYVFGLMIFIKKKGAWVHDWLTGTIVKDVNTDKVRIYADGSMEAAPNPKD